MLFSKVTLGDISDKANCMFVEGKDSPGMIVIPRRKSFSLWSLRTSCLIAILGRKSKVLKDLTIAKVSRLQETKEILVFLGFTCGTIQVWRLNLKQITSWCINLKGHQKGICSFGQKMEGDFFISGCLGGDIVKWNISKQKGSFRITSAHKENIIALKMIWFFGNQLSSILSCGNDALVKFWDFKTGKCLRVFGFNFQKIFHLDFHSKTRVLIFSTEKRKAPIFGLSDFLDLFKIGQIWWFSTPGKFYLRITPFKPVVFLFNKKGNIEITILNSEKICTQNPKKKIQKNSTTSFLFASPILFSLENEVQGMDIWQNSKNKKIFLLIHWKKSNFLEVLQFFSLNKNTKTRKNSLVSVFTQKLDCYKGEIRSLLWLSNDDFVISLEGSSKIIQTWHWNTQKCVNLIKTFSRGICFEFCGQKMVAVGCENGSMEIYDLKINKLVWIKKKAHTGPIWSLDTMDNFLLMATGGSDGILKIWEFETATAFLNKQLLLKDQILGIKLIRNKNMMIICGFSSKISVFFLKTLNFAFSLIGHNLPVISVGICDNLELFGTGSADFSIKIWNLIEKKEVKTIMADENAITSLEFQKFSKNFFSGSRGGKIKFWDGRHFSLICEISQFHSGPVWILRSSENGKFVASGSQDKTVVVWEIEKNENLKTPFFEEKKNSIKKEKKRKINGTSGKKNISRLEDFKKMFETIRKRKLLEKTGTNLLDVYPFLDSLLENFKSLSNKEIHLFFNSLNQKKQKFFLDQMLCQSIQTLIIDPSFIFNQLFFFLRKFLKNKSTQQTDSSLKIFRHRVKRILKKLTIQTELINQGLNKIKKGDIRSDLPDSN